MLYLYTELSWASHDTSLGLFGHLLCPPPCWFRVPSASKRGFLLYILCICQWAGKLCSCPLYPLAELPLPAAEVGNQKEIPVAFRYQMPRMGGCRPDKPICAQTTPISALAKHSSITSIATACRRLPWAEWWHTRFQLWWMGTVREWESSPGFWIYNKTLTPAYQNCCRFDRNSKTLPSVGDWLKMLNTVFKTHGNSKTRMLLKWN